MIIVKPSYEIETPIDGIVVLKHIEKAGRTCYKSEDKITDESAIKFAKRMMDSKHESVIEHFSFSVRFICDRGITHEVVRHRLASFSQESTRYCNYSKDKFGNQISIINPCWFTKDYLGDYGEEEKENLMIGFGCCGSPSKEELAEQLWLDTIKTIENTYFQLLDYGWTPQQARSVLPNSLKTEIVTTANLREWRHIFKLRTGKAAHPQIREIMIPLLAEMKTLIPVIFDDIEVEEK